MTRSTSQSSNSETTPKTTADAPQTGKPHGESGLEETPEMPAWMVERGRQERAAREAGLAKALDEKEWLRESVRRLLRGSGKPPAVLIDRKFPSWRSIRLPPSISEAQRAEIAEAIIDTRENLMPAGPEATGLILAKLAVVLLVPDVDDFKLMMSTYIEDLEEFPPEVLHDVCREWRRTQKFWPTIAELRELCQPKVKSLQRDLRRLLELDNVGTNPAPDFIITEDWLNAREKDAKRALEAPRRPHLTVVGEGRQP